MHVTQCRRIIHGAVNTACAAQLPMSCRALLRCHLCPTSPAAGFLPGKVRSCEKTKQPWLPHGSGGASHLLLSCMRGRSMATSSSPGLLATSSCTTAAGNQQCPGFAWLPPELCDAWGHTHTVLCAASADVDGFPARGLPACGLRRLAVGMQSVRQGVPSHQLDTTPV